MSFILEICANGIQSAINAELGGADRIELCDNLWEGGATPSYAMIEHTVNRLNIPVFVLIRPRGGDFVYSDLEFEVLKRDIECCVNMGVAGIVSGILLPDGNVDIERTSLLKRLSGDLPFTFHRAFDVTPDPMKALDELISIGIDRILTSGQQLSASSGSQLIKNLVDKSEGSITILPGGGITIENISNLIEAGCKEFHLSAKSYERRTSSYEMKVPMNGLKDIIEDEVILTNVGKVKQIRNFLDAQH